MAKAAPVELQAHRAEGADPEDRDEYRCTDGPIAGAQT